MTWMRNKFITHFLTGMALTAILNACNNKKKDTLSKLNKVVGQHVQLSEDSILQNKRTKILILIEDTGNCSSCHMRINEWYIYNLDLKDRELQGDIIYILKRDMHLPLSVDTMLEQYGLYKSNSYENLIEQNPFLQENSYSTFLLSVENKIIVAGSPLDAPKLWSVYRKAIRKE